MREPDRDPLCFGWWWSAFDAAITAASLDEPTR
jgi:hypothetical protein